MSGHEPGPDDFAAFTRERLERYIELWDSVNSKLSERRYHAADLVDDSFRWIGLLAQDTAAAATLILRAASGAAQSREPGAWEQGSSPR